MPKYIVTMKYQQTLITSTVTAPNAIVAKSLARQAALTKLSPTLWPSPEHSLKTVDIVTKQRKRS